MKILTVVGARPQFVKAAVVSREISKHSGLHESIIHTGQHYDKSMSESFFEQLDIPKPLVNLAVGSGSHGVQTARMLEGLENQFKEHKPDCVLVYGDTNSTLAGALAAAKLHIPVAHVEAGLRSFNKQMPEEINRITTDHVSDQLFAPSKTAMKNLKDEGLSEKALFTGDVMYDAVIYYREKALRQSNILSQLNLEGEEYYLCTIHRAENTDNPKNFEQILSVIESISEQRKVVFPVHPRTKNLLQGRLSGVELCEPLPYLDLLCLLHHSQKVITDSGGLQKEAFWFEKPCITVREETEWVETLENGWNILSGARIEDIIRAVNQPRPMISISNAYGGGKASSHILKALMEL